MKWEHIVSKDVSRAVFMEKKATNKRRSIWSPQGRKGFSNKVIQMGYFWPTI